MLETGLTNQKKGILVVAHGSRNLEANDFVHVLVGQLKDSLQSELVEAGFLDFAKPSISGGIKLLAESGADELLVYPFFLAKGVHLKEDIPRIVKETVAGLKNPIPYRILEPLGLHPGIFDIIADTLREEVSDD